MAGTVVFTQQMDGQVRRVIATCTGDAADGSFPATALPAIEGRLVELRTNPGSGPPQANYDVALTDGDGLDRLQGLGVNRHTTSSEVVPIVFTGTSISPTVEINETLTLAVTGNNVVSAVTVVTLVFLPA